MKCTKVRIDPRSCNERLLVTDAAGHDLETGEEVALKLESQEADRLENEIEIYKELSGGPGIPQIYWHGEEYDFKVMAFELLGPNLEDLLSYCGRRFSLKTVLLLADQLICRLRYIHSKGYIHRDIKPQNILIGDGKQGNTVYITDIGLAKEIEREDQSCHVFIGTLRYSSINAQLRKGE